MSKNPYYEKEGFKLIKGNSFKELKKIESKSIDMIFADREGLGAGGEGDERG